MAAVEMNKKFKKHKKMKNDIEPIKGLCIKKRNLDRIETERIYRVIQVACKNIIEAKCLCEIIKNDALIFLVTDLELRNLLFSHQIIMRKFERYNRESDMEEKNVDISFSLQSVLRCMHSKGISLVPYLKKRVHLERTSFDKNINALRDVIHEKLLTDAEDEKARSNYLLQIMEQARNSHKVINHLSDVLKEKSSEKDHLLNGKNLLIRQLQRSLDTMLQSAGEENNTVLNDAAKQILIDQKSLENKQSRLQQDILDSSDALHKERKTNYDEESKLRKRKFKMAGELYNWIVKYDQDLGWRQEEIDEITEAHNQDLEEIKQLQIHFLELQKEYDAILEERRVEQEAKIKAEEEKALKRRAIIKIQAVCRGWLTRENVKTKKKGGKKAKGKKGGKK